MTDIKITLKKAKFFIGYETEQENCDLCRHKLSGPSLQELKNNTIKMEIVIGNCDHIYHKTCIRDFIKSGYIFCPICHIIWEEKRTFTSQISLS